MGGRFGKYGDLKRKQALRRSRREKTRLSARAHGRRAERRSAAQGQTAGPTATKTVRSAVVVIPPEDLWTPIQALRQRHDRHYRRWMPHITLLYPYRPVTAFKTAVPRLARACRSLAPFDLRLERFDVITHARKATIYLTVDPAAALQDLHQALREAAPDCDDTARFPSGFTPHLSVAQAARREAVALCARWQAAWQPLCFTLTHVTVIWRNEPPDDVFRTGPTVPLKQRSKPIFQTKPQSSLSPLR